jgi:L-ascorbate metabolism protein UlaG (beta-lactamase superfamily)
VIIPRLSHATLLNDIAAVSGQREAFHLWWLGQSGFLLHWMDEFLLIDPYLSNSLTKKYAGTDKPHERMSELVIEPSQLDFISMVTSSHNHTDHLDPDTLVPLMRVNPDLAVVVPAANVDFAAERLGVESSRLQAVDAGESFSRGHFTLNAVPAAHESVERDSFGRCRYLGYVITFGQWAVYHSGDTVRFKGLETAISRWNVDVAILPINGRSPERRVAGNLCGREAAQLAFDVGARLAVPCHYDMFYFNTASPDEFVEHSRGIGQNIRVLQLGERFTSSELPAAGAS